MPTSLDISNCNNNISNSNVTVVQLIFFGSFLCVNRCLVSKVAVVTPTSQGWGCVGRSLCVFRVGIPEVLLANVYLLPPDFREIPSKRCLDYKVPRHRQFREKPTF